MKNSLALKLVLIPLAILLWFPLSVSAQVVKTDGNLQVVFESEPLFNALNIVPGFSESKTVIVKNIGADTEDSYVSVANATSTGLADFINLEVSSTSTIPTQQFSGSFNSFFNQTPVDLGDLMPGEERTYTFTASFVSTSSNAYGGTAMGFNLVVGFESGPAVITNGSGGGGTNTNTTQGVPTILGASTSTQPFWEGIISRLNDLAERSLGAVLGVSDAQATTTGEDATDEDRDGGVAGATDSNDGDTPWYEFICDYLWIFVIIWIIASAVAFYFRHVYENVNIIFITQTFFAAVAIAFLISTLFFGVPCSLWPTLKIAVGSIIGLVVSRD